MLRMYLLLACVLIHSGGRFAWAKEPAAQPTLFEIQVRLTIANERAWRELDFRKSLELFREMREVTAERSDEVCYFDVSQIDYILRDLERIEESSPEQKQLAVRWIKEMLKGADLYESGKYQEALPHYRDSLELALAIFDQDSCFVVDAQHNTASDLLAIEAPKEREEGVALALAARASLEKQQLTKIFSYRKVNNVLSRLYYKQEKYAESLEAGRIAISLYKEHKAEGLPDYALVAGITAECLLRLGKTEESLECSRSALNDNPPRSGRFAPYRIRLLQQYVRAKIALNDFEKVDLSFQQMLLVADSLIWLGYPTELRIEHREEYLKFLHSQGETKRAEEIQAEIEEIKAKSTPQKSRYSD